MDNIMGIYTKHGIEYLVRRPNENYICIAGIHETHTRFVMSSYFASNKHHFTTMDPQMYRQPIEEQIDVVLTPDEATVLSQVLNVYEDVISHGWYDVNLGIRTTY